MPTVDEELAAVRARARARKAQKERDAAQSRPLSSDPAVRAKVGAASERARAEGVSKDTPPEAKPNPLLAIPGFQQPTQDIQRTFADRLTRGAADYASSAMSGNTLEEEQKETSDAAARAGKAGKAFGIVGDLAPAAMLPAASVAGPVRAAMTGAGLAGTDTTLNSLFREGEAPTMAEVGTSAAMGAGGGVAGFYAGRFFMDRYMKLVGADKPLHQQTRMSLQKTIDEQNNAANMMRNADVKLNRFSVVGLRKRIEKEILNDRDLRTAFKLKDGAPLARKALQQIDELVGVEPKPSFDELNELRKIIRDSPKNANGEVVGSYSDAKIIRKIDEKIRDYLLTLGDNPNAKHVVSGNVKQAVSGFKEMNRLTQAKDKQNHVSALLERAHYSETAGTSYDKAVQQQFKAFVQPNLRGKRNPELSAFSDDEIKLLEEAAEGGLTTKILNRLDNSFGHGMLADLHRTYSIATRKAMKPGAIREAGKVFEGVGGELPTQPVVQQGLGARTGIAGGMLADDELTQSLPQPQSP